MIHNEAQNVRENENYRGGGDSSLSGRPINALPSNLGSVYASDSDSASRTKSNQRNRGRRRPPQDRQPEETPQSPLSHAHVNTNPGVRHEPRVDTVNVNTVPPMMPHGVDALPPMPYLPPPCWGKPDERIYPSPLNYAMPPPPGALPMSSCACACALWAAWSWQQCALQQRETLALRQQIASLEERWRSSVETASHTLNNQVPPGNRANNYWDNFRSYSRQNLLSASSKTNADGHLGVVPQHNPHPLVERSHNTLHAAPAPTPPSNTPKRNINASTTQNTAQTNQPINNAEEFTNRHGRSNVTYERSLSFSSAPDVLNLNQNNEQEASSSQARNLDDVNINRQEPANAFRNLNITNPIPEIIQSHANNINTTSNSLNSKKKSCSKLPAKNSANRRNNALDYSQTSNINIASTSEAPNPNLASANREVNDKATTKLFEFLRENVYSEVTALIGVNESHPDFLIQLFRELQLISSDPLRHRVLQSIRSVLSQYPPIIENENNEHIVNEEQMGDTVTTTTHETNSYQENAMQEPNSSNTNPQNDNGIVHFLFLKSEDVCSPELLDMLASVIINSSNSRQQLSKKRILETLAKYEGSRVCDVSGEILESLSLMLSVNNDGDESTQHTGESESSILQDVAGSLNLFSSSDTQLHQMNGFPYDMWAGHMELDQGEDNARNDGKLDLINCSEMLNGELAEADQTCPEPPPPELPDVVEDETTPTEVMQNALYCRCLPLINCVNRRDLFGP
ncbi:hypothetical protein JYU34_009833 [Plutella xylostella]|uniref:Pericentriolar material 1 protein C-terminal domain-containing protein n=2 Tax=Plutella xylostella TaxID=51655 RepID=A0ABQ7QKJ4_PLUXY|nr:hypothetical protein JYU34_009833 [Plutella xylostella]